jgi:hypothetical protein
MLYLGIDQHARPITVSLRDEGGDVLQARQVSTQPDKINAFFQQLTRERLHNGESFAAVPEVCGFNDWLIRLLQDYHCYQVILIQPNDRKQCKTDRRDAAALSELGVSYFTATSLACRVGRVERFPVRSNPGENRFRLTNSFRDGPTSMREPLSRPEQDEYATAQISLRHLPHQRSARRVYAVE